MVSKGIIGLGLLGALGAFALFSGSASASPSGGTPGGGTKPNGQGDYCDFDTGVPANVRTEANKLLAQLQQHPALIENARAMADAADQGGYPKLAACLRGAAQAAFNQAQLDMAAKGGMDFTVRYGDIPYHLAEYYTGTGSRFSELKALNPQMGPLVTVSGVSNYQNWAPGLKILIPASWAPLDKPLPVPLSTGGASTTGPNYGSMTPAERAQAEAAAANELRIIEDLFGIGPDHPPQGTFPPNESGQ